MRENLITQLDSPVRWVETIQAMRESGIELFIESGPGKVLAGMIKRIDRQASVKAIEAPDDLA